VILYIKEVIIKVQLNKQAEKYLGKCPQNVYKKLVNALLGLEEWRGDIVELAGQNDVYRLKVPPFRILFTYTKGADTITVIRISPRGDAYKKG